MADFEHAQAMLRMAHKDFNALTGMLDNTVFADEIFGFHVQQTVEKALKALDMSHRIEPTECSRLRGLFNEQRLLAGGLMR
jgi:HEPN domain-containing protein